MSWAERRVIGKENHKVASVAHSLQVSTARGCERKRPVGLGRVGPADEGSDCYSAPSVPLPGSGSQNSEASRADIRQFF